jgi:hypothetical protein
MSSHGLPERAAMIANHALALTVGFMIFVCVIMPGITRYVIVGSLIMLLADYTIQRATSGSVNLIPFLSL